MVGQKNRGRRQWQERNPGGEDGEDGGTDRQEERMVG